MNRRIIENISDKIKLWDLMIRQGESALVRKELQIKLATGLRSTDHRGNLVEIAVLCRRCGMPEQGVRLLHPLIRPKVRSSTAATDAERLEYGASLVQIGVEREGTELLKTVNPQKHPKALLFLGFSKITRWEYLEAIPLFEKFINHSGISTYDRDIGRVNLLTSLVAVDQFEKADRLASDLLRELDPTKQRLLYSNVLGSCAEMHLSKKDWRLARHFLKKTENLQQKANSFDVLIAQKWDAVLKLKRHGWGRHTQLKMSQLRQKGLESRSWEIVRDCDYQIAREKNDLELLKHVFYGTPFEAYRKRISSESYFDRIIWEPTYLWHLGRNSTARTCEKTQFPILDVINGQFKKTQARLKAGQVKQRLLQLLSSDFYQPFGLDAIFDSLFPNTYFNPTSSPVLVHQALFRLRRWLEQNQIPLKIDEQQGRYCLIPMADIALKVYLPDEQKYFESKIPLDRSKALQLKDYFAKLTMNLNEGESFSRVQLASLLDVSDRTAGRFIQFARELGLIERIHHGPATRYRISQDLAI